MDDLAINSNIIVVGIQVKHIAANRITKMSIKLYKPGYTN